MLAGRGEIPGGRRARLGEVVATTGDVERLNTTVPSPKGAREHRPVRRGTVTRRVLGVDLGELAPGPARWNKYFYCGTPESALGVEQEDVVKKDVEQEDTEPGMVVDIVRTGYELRGKVLRPAMVKVAK